MKVIDMLAKNTPYDEGSDEDATYVSEVTITTVENGWILSYITSEEEEVTKVFKVEDAKLLLEELQSYYLAGR